MIDSIANLIKPPSQSDELTLTVNGKQFGGWKEIKVTRSLTAIASGFSVSLTDRWTQEGQPWIIRPGDSATVKIGSDTVIVGYVDALNTSLSASDRTISVSGREKTCDLVDCSLDQHEFLNVTLEDLAKKTAAPFGVSVKNLAGVRTRIPSVAVSNGETVHQVLDKYAKKQGVVLTSDGLGTLVMAKLGAVSAALVLQEGENLLSCSASFDNRERFSQYIVRGGNNYQDEDVVELQTGAEGRAKDTGVSRFRLKIVNAESPVSRDEAAKRAQWELVTRQAKAWTVSAKVQGWRAGKALWAPNTLVKIQSPAIGIDAVLLVTDVTFQQTISGGTTTELKLARKDAFIPAPEKPDEKDLLAGLIAENSGTSDARLLKKLEGLYGSF